MALPSDAHQSRTQFELSAALKVTTKAHVVEILREEGTRGMHIAQLAEKCGMEPSFLRELGRGWIVCGA